MPCPKLQPDARCGHVDVPLDRSRPGSMIIPISFVSTNSMSEVVRAVGTCGAQLGEASDRYGAGDVADDVDAVRAAFGFDKIDLSPSPTAPSRRRPTCCVTASMSTR
jgi:hypothetical protein